MVRALVHKVFLAGLADWRDGKKREASVVVGDRNPMEEAEGLMGAGASWRPCTVTLKSQL
jgi:hypothetical protein